LLNRSALGRVAIFHALVATAALGSPALAQSPQETVVTKYDNSIFLMAGRLHSGDWTTSLNVLGAPYEDNYVIGGGAQHFAVDLPLEFRLGVEGGLVVRMGEATQLEGWGGIVARYDGFVFNDDWRISPSLTWGLSFETDSIGSETVRAGWVDQSSQVLFYLSPEISLGRKDENMELFWRIQHRSGAWCLIACINGTNANTVGMRWKF